MSVFLPRIITVVVLFVAAICVFAQDNIEQHLISTDNTATFSNIEKSANEWSKLFVAPNYLYNKDSRYIFMPKKADGDWDLVKMRYSSNNYVVTITQSISMFAIQIDGLNNKNSSITDINKLAHKIFNFSDDLSLLQNTKKGVFCGSAKSNNIKSPWLSGLKWAVQINNSILFYFIKDDGHPSALDKGYDNGSNANWFPTK